MSTDTPDTNGDQPPWRRWLAFIIALAVLGIGIWLLVDLWGGRPVAAPFTRVGGETRVETALEASRFWREPPSEVVTIPGQTGPYIMLEAAKCAMARNAPLLYTSPDPKRQRAVDATVTAWERAATNNHARFKQWDEGNLKECQKGVKPDLSGLSTLKMPGESSGPSVKVRVQDSLDPLVVKGVTAQDSLAPLVVFAAAKAPGDPPDIAVGLALAAHMARVRKASVVAVPRYLEADPSLEGQLRKQSQVVEGGIVLGEPRIMPDNTRTLLRQLLSPADQQSFVGEVRNTLGSAGTLVAALVALLGLGKVITTAPRKEELPPWLKGLASWLKNRARELRDRGVKNAQELWESIVNRKKNRLQSTLAAWLDSLDKLDKRDQKGPVTIRLISGWEITATIPESLGEDDRDAMMMRLEVTDPAKLGEEGAYSVLVRVEDIESIRVPHQKVPTSEGQPSPDNEKPNQASAGPSSSATASSRTKILFGDVH